MAKKSNVVPMNPETKNPDAATAKANMSNRLPLIRAVKAEIDPLEAECKAIRARIAAIKSEKVKGQLGMKLRHFNAACVLVDLEQDDRDHCISTFQEVFEAFDVGVQLNWLDAAPDAPKTEVPPRATKSRKPKAAAEPAKVAEEEDPAKGSFVQQMKDEDDLFGGALEEDEGVGHESSDMTVEEELMPA